MGDPELDEQELLVLGAYHQAVKSATAATAVSAAPDTREQPSHDEQEQPTEGKPAVRVQPTILRLAEIEGVESELLSGIHGKLIAAGYLTAEVVGRSDGIVYRLTREGQRRLAGESLEEAA